jgi:long-subunit fatty acid transport protein
MKKFSFFVLVVSLFGLNVSAGVLNRPGNGLTARDLATAGGFSVADPEGAAAIFLNPAALTGIQNWAWDFGMVGLYTDFSYDRDPLLGGGSFDAQNEWFPFPYGAVAYRYGDFVFAFGLDVPYGQAADYGSSLGFDSKMSFADLSVGAAYQLNEYFSLGAALQTVYGQTKLRFPLFDPTGTMFLGLSNTRADGIGFGCLLGAQFKYDSITVGLIFAPAVEVGISGKTRFPAAVGIPYDRMHADIYQPEGLGVGISWQAMEDLKVGMSYFRTDYGRNDQVAVRHDNLPTNILDLGWGVVDSVHAGVEYQFNEAWTLRTGAAWMSGGTPDYSPPSVPDGDGWIVSVGAGCKVSRHTFLDVGGGYFWADRNVPVSPRNIGAGGLDLEGFMFGVSIRQEF